MFFKPKKIILNCYTHLPYVYNFAPVIPAIQAFPKWISAIPTTYDRFNTAITTVKGCYGITNQYKKGVVIPMWSDLSVSVGKKGATDWEYLYSDQTSAAEVHTQNQRGTYLPEVKYQHLKLFSPWYFVCNEDIHWQLIGMPYNFDAPETVLFPPGILEFRYQHGVNINMIFPRNQRPTIHKFSHGQPMIQLIPLTERDVEIKTHLVSEQEYNKIQSKHTMITFLRKYQKIKKLLKQSNKCPMSGFIPK